MAKRIVAAVLCLLLVAVLPLEAAAAGNGRRLTLSTAEDLLRLAEKCRLDSYSRGAQVVLAADLDLTGLDFQGIPYFDGTFDGGGYTVSGLNITREGSVTGFFRYLTENAEVKNLCLAGTVIPGGSRGTVGALAGSNAGTVTNCTFDGKVSGSERVGGLVGVNTVTGTVEKSTVTGTVEGDHFAGGIVGENVGVIRNCVNEGQINTTPQQNRVEISDITLETLTGSENAVTVTDIGGIAGISSGVIRNCENRGDVGYKHMGYNVGGIVGSQTGLVTGCENQGAVSGRKEVGGIVGHLEPGIRMEFSEDTLQTLKGQMDTLGELAGDAATAAQGGAAAISGQIGALRGHTQTARDALEQLTPSVSTPDGGLPEVDFPDRDSVQAAQNALSGSITGVQSSMEGLAAAAQGAAGALTSSLQAISQQAEIINQTLSDASGNLGGTVTDVSDEDTSGDTTGKIYGCRNYGEILADRNAGGIVGAMALEMDLDPESDISISGNTSLNFAGMLRAVVLECSNQGSVTAKKQNTGGIAGWMDMGLVKKCINTGSVAGGDYAGGIAGRSDGYIRGSSAKCGVTGDSSVGGIAGLGRTVTDCRSMVALSAREKQGALLGELPSLEAISGNYYLVLEEDPGAIDGISYAGCGESLSQQQFLNLEGLPSIFRWVTVRFLFEDGTEETRRIQQGKELAAEKIPELPEKPGYTAEWEGLETQAPVFDTVVRAVYTPYRTVIASTNQRTDGRPVLLAEGSFPPDAEVTVEASELLPEQSRNLVWKAGSITVTASEAVSKATVLEALRFTVPEDCGQVVYRYLPPEGTGENPVLLVRQEDGSWAQAQTTRSGSYLVFDAVGTETVIVLTQEQTGAPWWAFAVGGAVLILAALAICLVIRKKKRSC